MKKDGGVCNHDVHGISSKQGPCCMSPLLHRIHLDEETHLLIEGTLCSFIFISPHGRVLIWMRRHSPQKTFKWEKMEGASDRARGDGSLSRDGQICNRYHVYRATE